MFLMAKITKFIQTKQHNPQTASVSQSGIPIETNTNTKSTNETLVSLKWIFKTGLWHIFKPPCLMLYVLSFVIQTTSPTPKQNPFEIFFS